MPVPFALPPQKWRREPEKKPSFDVSTFGKKNQNDKVKEESEEARRSPSSARVLHFAAAALTGRAVGAIRRQTADESPDPPLLAPLLSVVLSL